MITVSLPVSKRGNDQTLCTAQKLVLVDKIHICNRDLTLVLVFQKVESGLLHPFKVCGGLDMHATLQKKNSVLLLPSILLTNGLSLILKSTII